MKFDRYFYSMGTALKAIVEMPDKLSDKKYPCIILCHGHSRHKNDGLDVLSARLIQDNFITLRMDFRGCGREAAKRYQLYCGIEWPEDLISAVAYAKSIPEVDRNRIGVCGISMGASTAVYASGISKSIKSTVSMAGISDCYEWLKWVWEKNNGDFGEFLQRLEQDSIIAALTGNSQIVNSLDMYHMTEKEKLDLVGEAFECEDVNSFVSLNALSTLLRYKPIEKCSFITQPIFFLHGERDEIVPYRESENMYHAVLSEMKKIKRYQGVEHNIPIDSNREEAFEDIADWFVQTL